MGTSSSSWDAGSLAALRYITPDIVDSMSKDKYRRIYMESKFLGLCKRNSLAVEF